ncbi:MAG: hypothetical protein AAF658_08330, partial [Myxococcota bacterium]
MSVIFFAFACSLGQTVDDALPSEQSLLGQEAELMLQLAEEDISERRLELYGFSDLTYYDLLLDADSPYRAFFERNSTFLVGNLNLYIAAELGPSFRALAEVRFLYSSSREFEDEASIVWRSLRIRDYG